MKKILFSCLIISVTFNNSIFAQIIKLTSILPCDVSVVLYAHNSSGSCGDLATAPISEPSYAVAHIGIPSTCNTSGYCGSGPASPTNPWQSVTTMCADATTVWDYARIYDGSGGYVYFGNGGTCGYGITTVTTMCGIDAGFLWDIEPSGDVYIEMYPNP